MSLCCELFNLEHEEKNCINVVDYGGNDLDPQIYFFPRINKGI